MRLQVAGKKGLELASRYERMRKSTRNGWEVR
jgi:hypothetical protein